MTTRWRIHVRDRANRWVDDDFATSESEAREQAAGWTGQRGQLAWTAVVYNPKEEKVATYKRGKEAP